MQQALVVPVHGLLDALVVLRSRGWTVPQKTPLSISYTHPGENGRKLRGLALTWREARDCGGLRQPSRSQDAARALRARRGVAIGDAIDDHFGASFANFDLRLFHEEFYHPGSVCTLACTPRCRCQPHPAPPASRQRGREGRRSPAIAPAASARGLAIDGARGIEPCRACEAPHTARRSVAVHVDSRVVIMVCIWVNACACSLGRIFMAVLYEQADCNTSKRPSTVTERYPHVFAQAL